MFAIESMHSKDETQKENRERVCSHFQSAVTRNKSKLASLFSFASFRVLELFSDRRHGRRTTGREDDYAKID